MRSSFASMFALSTILLLHTARRHQRCLCWSGIDLLVPVDLVCALQ